jgi:hypothetical protein
VSGNETLIEHYRDIAVALLRWLTEPACSVLNGDERLLCALRGYHGGREEVSDVTSKFPVNCLLAAQRLRQFSEAIERREVINDV